jgi:nitrogen fixation protein FixH
MTQAALAPTAERSNWRFFPLGLLAALGVVIIVNLGMVYMAISTFPGEIVHTNHK